MPIIAKIDLRPYIENPHLYITERLLTSLENELRIFTDIVKTHPEYQKFIPEIKKEIEEVKKELNKECIIGDKYENRDI